MNTGRLQLALLLLPLASACGGESSGLLSDHLVCGDDVATMESLANGLDTTYAGSETAVTVNGSSTSGQPTLAQQFSTSAEKQNVWGVAIKLVAPKGAGDDLVLSIRDVSSGSSVGDTVYGHQTIPAEKIGTTATWLLVDFGEVVTLAASTSFQLALAPAYRTGEARPVSWLSGTGTGQQSLSVSAIGLGSWAATGHAGIYALGTCQ